MEAWRRCKLTQICLSSDELVKTGEKVCGDHLAARKTEERVVQSEPLQGCKSVFQGDAIHFLQERRGALEEEMFDLGELISWAYFPPSGGHGF